MRSLRANLASYLAVCSAALLVAACAKEQAVPPPPKPKPEIGTFGFDVNGMDKSVAPGDDFFRYAVGKWVDSTEIPPDRSSLGSFAVIRREGRGAHPRDHRGQRQGPRT